MKIGIIGTGYVGLVTGTCFAEMGNEVICVDIDKGKIARLRKGELPIFEPGLEVYLERSLRENRLSFTTDLAAAVTGCDVLFLALPTPPGEDGSADLSYVIGVAQDIARLIKKDPDSTYKVIVNKSTVPVGTAKRVTDVFVEEGLLQGEDFDVVSNPEFLREGVAVDDFMKPERVVIGTSSERAAKVMRRLYEPFVRQGNPILVMDERSSEVTKYAANAFLATKITFMNEIANVCEKVGANVDEIRRGMGLDSRIGNKFLYAGIGFGGSCFPKDVQALERTASGYGYQFEILKSVIEVNNRQRQKLADQVIEHFGGSLENRTIAIWGLAFKPNTDDVREAPSHVIIRRLLAAGATVKVFDPEAIETTKAVLGDVVTYCKDDYSAVDGADALVICTEWHEFRRPNFERVKEALNNPLIFDGRNLYAEETILEYGFEYYSIGRPPVMGAGIQEAEITTTNGTT